MNLGDIFSKTWKDYKVNFKVLFKIMLIFVVIPSFFLLLVVFTWDFTSGRYPIIEQQFITGNFTEVPLDYSQINIGMYVAGAGVYLLLSLIALSLLLLVVVGIMTTALKDDKIKYKSIISNGKKYYWASLGFFFVIFVFLFGLYILLIIPGIIFSIYWFFSYYVYIDKNVSKSRGIRNSLRESRMLVRGKWWKTLGYLCVFYLLMFVISIVAELIVFIPTGIFSDYCLASQSMPLFGYLLLNIFTWAVNSIVTIITLPLGILFGKNFYLTAKKEWKA